MQRNIMKDTILLTVIQMTLDGLGLLLNVFMTDALGTEAIGVLSLTGSFFSLASITASGNVFLCASRFISEELGKPSRDPSRVLSYCLCVSLAMSLLTALVILLFAPFFSEKFLHDTALTSPIRMMAAALPLLTITACMRGYFNACCYTKICAASDTIGFLVRCVLMAFCVWWITPVSGAAICYMTAFCTVGGSLATLIYLLCCFRKCRIPRSGSVSISLPCYVRLAVPVMAGSALTSILSSANDALVPITLQQAGNSTGEALSQFGIFEAIIIPTLFFPSTILCSLSGILVTETARESAACNKIRITSLSEKVLRQTVVFAVFVTALFLLFGRELGELLGGGEIGGKMIMLLAPVVPFIYLEIVLESIIKGMGAQAFSSLNYLAEYIIRISAVLVCIPLFGFYGIVISYYASNVCGNLARLWMVTKKTDLRPQWEKLLGIPVFSAVFAIQLLNAAFAVLRIEPDGGVVQMCIYGLLCGCVYLLVQRMLFSLGSHQQTTIPESL
ncbi:MAG: oligosaccharide flippase family protein [Oscillospiraceae bacterium]|nr:oligosaccharide flippase family protein [Oscillospiraceae bacterium]